MMSGDVVTVFGGTGFLGEHIVSTLVGAGYAVKIVSRRPDHGNKLRVAGRVGQISSVYGDVRDTVDNIEKIVCGSYAVINAVGARYDSAGSSMISINAKAAENIALAVSQKGIERFVHISVIGASDNASSSVYLRSKLLGENAIKRVMPSAMIVRPNMMIGARNPHLRLMARVIKSFPILPILHCGKLQPVVVSDVAKIVVALLGRKGAMGRSYDVSGDRICSLGDIARYIAGSMGIHELRCMQLSKATTKVAGYILNTFFAKLLLRPLIGSYAPLLTPDQAETMSLGFVSSDKSPNAFKDLGVPVSSTIRTLSDNHWIV